MFHQPRPVSWYRTCIFACGRYVYSRLAQSIERVEGKLYLPQEVNTTGVLPVLFGWTLSNQRSLAKYAAIYNDLGLPAVCATPTIPQMWLTKMGAQYSAQVFSTIADNVAQETKIVLHCFSAASTAILPFISTSLPSNLSLGAAIFDSGPVPLTRDTIFAAAKCGLSQGVIGLSSYHILCTLGSVVVFFSGFNKRVLEAEARVSNAMKIPQLYLYSEADSVALVDDVEKTIAEQMKLGRAVEKFKWKDSGHVKHLLQYHKDYYSTVVSFLNKYHIV